MILPHFIIETMAGKEIVKIIAHLEESGYTEIWKKEPADEE
jgi:hypothetical protein